jgi:hypothetical protein
MENPPDYSKTKIYMLKEIDNDDSEIYIGHTINWRIRKSNHKRNCNNASLPKYNYKVYNHIRINGGWCKWKMYLLEECFCNNKIEAKMKEQEYIKIYNPTLNVIKAFVSDEEKKERERIYYQNNKKEINKTHKVYNKNNKEKVAECKKVYRDNHKEELSASNKEYYQKHKAEILARQKLARLNKNIVL